MEEILKDLNEKYEKWTEKFDVSEQSDESEDAKALVSRMQKTVNSELKKCLSMEWDGLTED